MASRLDLHDELKTFCPNVYFQPPSNITMIYPCIIYHKVDKMRFYGSDGVHFMMQEYRITVIDKNPDSDIADKVEGTLQYSAVERYYTIDNLNHTILSLFY